MMRRMSVLIALLLVGPAVGWAEEVTCPPGTRLRVIGSVTTANDAGSVDHTISVTGHSVRASVITCGGSACVATLYDSDGAANGATPANADVRQEPGCAASTSCWLDYDPPLAFTEGITYYENANVAALLLYECR